MLLPTAKCLTPLECLYSPHNTGEPIVSVFVVFVRDTQHFLNCADIESPLVLPIGMDDTQLRSKPYQRVFQYLNQGESADAVTYSGDSIWSDDQTWIQLILR